MLDSAGGKTIPRVCTYLHIGTIRRFLSITIILIDILPLPSTPSPKNNKTIARGKIVNFLTYGYFPGTNNGNFKSLAASLIRKYFFFAVIPCT